MIKRFLKSSVTLLIILGVSFSNVPFYALSGLVDSYERTSGIVDKIWLVQQNHGSDVVDNFSSLRNISEKLRVMEAMAAVTYNTNSAFVYSAASGTSISPAYPTGVVANNLLVLIIGMKPSTANGGSVTTPAGWTPIVSLTGAGGYGTTLGADTGNTNIFSFYKVAVGGETGTLAVTIGTNNVSWARMHRMSNASGSWSVAGATGSDVAAGAVSIAFGTDPGVTAGDLVLGAMVIPTDVTTPAQFSAEAFTQTGVTFGTVTEIGEADTTTGNDMGGFIVRVPVSTGTASANPTMTATAGGTTTNVRGPGVFIRIRELTASNTTTITNFVSAEPGNSTIAPAASGLVDSFGFAASAGTDTVTAATVALAAGMGQYIQTVAITNDGDTVTYCSGAPSGDTASLTSCTVPVTTTNTQFKIKLTAKSHVLMPAPAGGSYAVTATVTGWTGTNATHAGTDSGSSTLTIDNASPNGATSVSGTAGNAANTINWTTSNSADFNTTNGSVILRWASGSAGAEVPAEGNSTYTAGNTITTATVACVISSSASTAQSKIDGTGGSAGCTTTALTNGQAYTYKAFQRDTNGNYDVGVAMGTFTPSAPATLTIGVTAGSKATNLNSGATSQYANTTACNSTATCSAFTILSSSGETLNSIKITETGTTNASSNLSNLALFYDTDGNYSNGVTGQYGSTVATYTTETATVSGSLALVTGTTYYFYVRTDLINGANDPVGGETINFQIAANADVTTSLASTKSGAPVSLAGTTTVKPNATAVTYQVNSDGGRSGYSATVTGNGFGVAPVGSRGSCSGVVNTGCVQFIVGGTATVATGDVSAWANRSLSFTVNSALASNGGASAIQVSSGAQTDATPLTFYIYPTLTSVTDCDKAGFPVGAFGREYDAGDTVCPNTLTDGAIIITGDHFGSAGSVTILGSTATQSAVAVFCGGSAYTSTCSALRVPTALAGNTGSIVLTRTSDSKTDTLAGFRVLPRITGFTPSSASEGGAVTVDGNHFCQGAGCPGSFSAGVNDVVFTSAKSAVTFTSWSATAMATVVPASAVTGDVVLTSDSYASNAKSFTVLSPTPNDPTSLAQKDGNLVVISVGGTASTTPIQLSMTMQAGVSGGTLYPQIEYKSALTSLVCGSGACASAIEGTGVAGQGPATGSVSITPTDDVYQWQARVCRNNGVGTHTASCGGTGDYPSTNWVLFGGNGAGATDFKVDMVAPVISGVSSSGPPSPGSNTATITWTTDEQSTSQVQYQAVAQASCTAYSFASSCGTNNDCTTINTTPVYSPHITSLSNLNSGTTYCYRVRSKDAVGNERIDTNNYWFTTDSISTPAKTTRFHISGSIGPITSGSPLSQSFSVVMPENATTTKSIFVEIKGVYTSGASLKNVSVQVNAETAKTYVIPPSSTSYFKIIHSANAINVDPGTNTLTITPQENTTLYILSADIYVNYAYTP